MTIKCVKSALVATLLVTSGLARAEDIDLFAAVGEVGVPNVLIILDNSANWSASIPVEDCYYEENGETDGSPGDKEQGKKMAIEKCALYNLIDALPTNADDLSTEADETGTAKFNIGLMLFNESPAANSGGYPRQAFTPLTEANRFFLKAIIKGIDIEDDKGNNAAFAKSLHEAYLYFTENVPYKGTAGDDWDSEAVPDGRYVLPSAAAESCGTDHHIIFIANGGPGEVTDGQAKDLLNGVGGNTTEISYIKSYITQADQGNWADEYARFLAGVDIDPREEVVAHVKTHGIAVTGAKSDGLYPNFINEMARQGEGSYYEASNMKALTDALVSVFNQIAGINSAFSAASLPVSVNTQGVYLNQVFIGMFRPDPNALPRWYGNLKQYQIAVAKDGITLNLADRNGALAIDPLSGFIDSCAKSYWTPEAVDTYWAFKEDEFTNACPRVADGAASNSPDGDAVEKGGAGYRLRAIVPVNRHVKTCTGDCNALTDFDAGNGITATSLGVAEDELSNLIYWVRGRDNKDENNDGVTFGQMRPSAHGDVIHSRPLAVDYGGTSGVVVFYGGNDGMLHAVEGGKELADGDELWSFVAPEHFSKLNRLWTNTPSINFPAKEPGATLVEDDRNYANNKDYFMDGSIGGYRTAAGEVWIYPTMRRGGRMVYAFDVTNPASPSLLWRHGCTSIADDTGCAKVGEATPFAGIGQTWSAVQVFLASGYLDLAAATDPKPPKPIAIFGGGYDTCEDNEPNTCASPKGNHIYVVDAEAGTLLNTLNTIRSVAADITVVDKNSDGKADLAYAVDTGGNLYRIDIGSAAPENWTLTQVAALGCDTPPCAVSGTYNRKFLYPPEVVVTNLYNVVLVGSGDREHPLETNGAVLVDNAFYAVKDYATDEGCEPPYMGDTCNTCWDGGDPASNKLICQTSLLKITPEGANPTTEELDAKKGWYLAFGEESSVHEGEQVVTSALVVGGVVHFSTHTPTALTAKRCGPNLGTARAYGVNFLTAADPNGTTTRFAELTGGGLPPSPVGGLVEIDGKLFPFIIGGRQLGGGASAGLEVQNAGLAVSGVRTRTHWYIEPPQ